VNQNPHASAHLSAAVDCLEQIRASTKSVFIGTEAELAIEHLQRVRVEMAQMWQLQRSTDPKTTSDELALLGEAAVVR
jgi:hypothetical protein